MTTISTVILIYSVETKPGCSCLTAHCFIHPA